MGFPSIPLEDRFWAKVDQTDPTGCWPWLAFRVRSGYGTVASHGVKPKRTLRAHRVAWELTNGPIPTGLLVLHKCDNPPCVNPDHLFLGTDADNQHDRHRKRALRGQPGERAKLTADEVRAIRKRISDGELQRQIAADYAICRTSVYDIAKRLSWAWLDSDEMVAVLPLPDKETQP